MDNRKGGSGMARYSVDTRFGYPILIRRECPDIFTFDPAVEGEWRESPEKASMLLGQDDFIWYDDISDKEAAKYIEEIRQRAKTPEKQKKPGKPDGGKD